MRYCIKMVLKLTVLLGVRHSHRWFSPYHIHRSFRQDRSWYLLRYRKSLLLPSIQTGSSHSCTNHVHLNTAFPRNGNDRRSSRLYCHDLPRSIQHNYRSHALDFASACEVSHFISSPDEGDTKGGHAGLWTMRSMSPCARLLGIQRPPTKLYVYCLLSVFRLTSYLIPCNSMVTLVL